MTNVLDEFLVRTKLLDEDRKLLAKQRGFDDVLIGNLHFRSACPENENIILSLLAEYGQGACAEAGLLHFKNSRPLATTKLLQRNIIIPYMEDGTCVALRPHKNFIKGKSLSVYYASEEYSEDATTIITEGEFKAAAATVFGYQAIAIPGISSFVGDKMAGRKFVEFYEDLHEKGIREVIILFDNEEKGDPSLPKYKEDPNKRYDVQYYAYLMCDKINEYGSDLEAYISWIPDKYRDSEGKADIDGMLATGVKEEEFDEIVNNKFDEEEFLDKLSDEAVDVIKGKLARREDRVTFAVRNGCYYIKFINPKDNKVEEQQVSNFTMKYLSATFDNEDGVVYEMEITNDKKQSTIVNLLGADWADYKRFRKTIASCGKYNWMSSGKTLDSLFLEVLPDDMKIIYGVNEIGWQEENQAYFFDNCIFNLDGSVIEADSDGIMKYNDRYIRVEKTIARQSIIFSQSAKKDGWKLEDVRDIANRLYKNYNTPYVYDAVSWMIGAAYKPWIFPVNRTFPLLGVFGRKNCGKTRMIQWLLSIFYENPEPIAFDASSKPGLRNQASELKFLPIWLDEFRNTQKGKMYLDMLRGIYDHNQVLISSSKAGKNQVFKLKSSLILSGEHIPADETGALNQRLITIQLPDKPVGTEFGWFETRYDTFGGIFRFLLENRAKYVDIIKAEYFQRLERYRKLPDIEQRIAINYALIHGISKVILGVSEKYLNLGIGDVVEDTLEDDATTDPILNMITYCLLYGRARGLAFASNSALTVRSNPGDGHKIVLSFNLNMCINLYNEILKKSGKTGVEVGQLRRTLKNHPWVDNSAKLVKISGKPVRCYTVDLRKAPGEVVTASYGFADDNVKKDMDRIFGENVGSEPQDGYSEEVFDEF